MSGDERGVGMIEILLVSALVCIIAAAAIPQITKSLQAYRLDSAAGSLADGLLAARLTAIKYNRAAWLKIDAANSAIEIWSTDDAGTQGRLKTVSTIPPQIAVVTGSPLQITFNSVGRNTAGSDSVVQFRIGGTPYCKSVTASAVGNITAATC
jgi:Tfp pilus assembly protein FimT